MIDVSASGHYVGDCRELLTQLPDGCVQTCITSPPYWGLRDYGNVGQIGLEPTLEAYVAELVAVFREVRRVLRDDGTLWLNLGDSYAGSRSGPQGKSGEMADREVTKHRAMQAKTKGRPSQQPARGAISGLKFKDLVGIPWMTAFALRQPYYTGAIRDERDRVWLAAMLDAEGCMFIHKRKAGQSNGQGYVRQSDSYGPGVEIANTSLAVVERIMDLVGKGSICSQGPDENARRKQRIYRWNLRTVECREFVRELYPYLVAKQHQARILYGCPSSGERAEASHAALIGLHRGSATDVDFPAPPSMTEPGFYLRQDIIWSKANPMPESVTDRCTKAHEYLFLLSKSERYYYDADAIREPLADKTLTTFGSRRRSKGTDALGRVAADNWTRDVPERKPKLDENGDHAGANKRSVWTVATQPYDGAHFATFPPRLIEPCVLSGAPPGALVLDPFFGSGTTGEVAEKHGRRWIGFDLGYEALAKERTAQRSLVLTGDA